MHSFSKFGHTLACSTLSQKLDYRHVRPISARVLPHDDTLMSKYYNYGNFWVFFSSKEMTLDFFEQLFYIDSLGCNYEIYILSRV
jgi:hypothetical protein